MRTLLELCLFAGAALGHGSLGHTALCSGHGPSLMVSGSDPVCNAAVGILPNITDKPSAAQSRQCQGEHCASSRRHAWTHTSPCFQLLSSNQEYCVFTDTNFADGRGISLIMGARRANYLATSPAFVEPELNRGVNQDLNRTIPAKYKVQEIPGKGMGVVATEHIRRGDLIIANTLSLLIDLEAYSLPKDEYLQLEAAAVDHLPSAHRAALLALSTHDEANLPHAEHIDKLIDTNSFNIYPDDGDEEGSDTMFGVFPEISRMNHDCRPNADYRFDRDTLAQYVTALRDIFPGEEITLTYIDPEMKRAARMKKLHNNWGFKCTCPLCTLDKHRADASDARIAQIGWLWDETREERGSPEMAELIISLYEQEKLWGKIPAAYYFAATEYNGAGDPWTAMKYAHLAIEVGIPSLGVNSHHVKDMAKLAADPWKHWSWMASVKEAQGMERRRRDKQENDSGN
ncbi:hypothetical protein MFIFM68171_10414 [Madurella fahalii]|uniref:SET domain-containing protein n=1 Tax=Madurella fahalii TaxID=1157608 RepID=A0ABQ0GR43_9PEZI